MNTNIQVKKRYELKYVLNNTQLEFLKAKLQGHMNVDQYGLTSIASIYFDTPNNTMLNHSIEKPEFKEKIRLRSYGLANKDSTLYLEIKRKAEGVVYKRRIALTEEEANLSKFTVKGKMRQVKHQYVEVHDRPEDFE